MMTTGVVDLSESRGAEINIVAWLSTGIAITAVLLKLFARAQIVKKVGWDDFFIFFSLALSIIGAACISYAVTFGLGRHGVAVVADHGKESLVLAIKWQILYIPFNVGCFSFPNISIAILLKNLLDPNPFHTRCLFTFVILQVVFALASILVIFLQCSPIEALWDPFVEGRCLDDDVFVDLSYWVIAYTTLVDAVLAIIPISVFWKLRIQFSTKLGICIMMGLTLLSAIFTIIKAVYLHLSTDPDDRLFNVVPLVLWGLIEQNVVIVAACVPTLRPVFHKAFAFGTMSSSPRNSDLRTPARPTFMLSWTARSAPPVPEIRLDRIDRVPGDNYQC